MPVVGESGQIPVDILIALIDPVVRLVKIQGGPREFRALGCRAMFEQGLKGRDEVIYPKVVGGVGVPDGRIRLAANTHATCRGPQWERVLEHGR